MNLRRQGDDRKAYGYFQRAFDLAHTPRTAAQLGLSELAIGRYQDAEEHLSQALRLTDPWVEANLPALHSARTKARAKLGKITISGAPANATVQANDRAAIPLPSDGMVWVAPGSVRLRITAPGFEPASAETITVVGENADVHVSMSRVPMADAGAGSSGGSGAGAGAGAGHGTGGAGDQGGAGNDNGDEADTALAREQRNRKLRVTGVVVASFGFAAGVTGIVFHTIAGNKIDAINSDGMAGRPYNPNNGNYQTYDRLGLGMIVGGATCVAAGVVTYLIGRHHPAEKEKEKEKEKESSVSLLAGPGDLGLAIGGRY